MLDGGEGLDVLFIGEDVNLDKVNDVEIIIKGLGIEDLDVDNLTVDSILDDLGIAKTDEGKLQVDGEVLTSTAVEGDYTEYKGKYEDSAGEEIDVTVLIANNIN